MKTKYIDESNFIKICRNGYVIGYQCNECGKLCYVREEHNCNKTSSVSFAIHRDTMKG